MLRPVVTALLCVSAVLAANSTAPAPAPAGSSNESVAFAPTTSIQAKAPSPAQPARVRTGNYAMDSLASTPTAYNQIQTVGVYSAAHIAPITAIEDYLATASSNVSGLQSANAPNSTQYSQDQLYNQLEFYGARSFHFPIYYDPTGKLYQTHAGLKIVNQSANTSAVDQKWTYPGWKVMNEPNFDFNTTCTTLVTCLFNIKNWLVSTPTTVPITIFLEPTNYTYTGTGSNATFAKALSQSSQTGAPTTLNQPLDIISFQPAFQPWRDLEREILGIFDNNEYFTIVTPDDVMLGADNLADAVLQSNSQMYPALNELENRVIFVLAGDYAQNYLQYYPDLKNASMFVSEPYNSDANYTNSTLFVDFLGTLSGVNASSFNVSAAKNASDSLATSITKVVEAGYMVRAAADWETIEPRANFSGRALDVLSAGAHFVQTSFPTLPTLFSSDYSVALPIRGNQKQSTRCNPVTTGGVYFNATEVYTVGCPALSGAPAAAPASSDAAVAGR